MRTGLLILAGAALMMPAVPAQAQHFEKTGNGSWTAPGNGAGVRVHRGPDAHRGPRDGRWGDSPDDRDWRWHGRGDVVIYDSGLWALYNNRSWEADSFNDWFQERPNRSLPRWVQENKGCKRAYWSGGGWTC